MKRTFTVKPSVEASRRFHKRAIKASTADEMIDAFEERIAELSVQSSTDVSCTSDEIDAKEKARQVKINNSDYSAKYKDVEGGFGEENAVYTLAEIKEFWNRENMGDPVLEGYDDYESWWNDTLNNFLKEVDD